MAAQVAFLAPPSLPPCRTDVQLQPGVVFPVHHLVQQVVSSPVDGPSSGHLLSRLWGSTYSALYVVIRFLSDGRCHFAILS